MELSTEQLLARSAELAAGGRRTILGITGAPGAGKSTLAELIAAELGPSLVALAPMDGFHIGDEMLVRMGERHRKGAPHTFDRAGYAAALARLRAGDHLVYLPRFERDREDSTAAAIAVPPEVPLVIAEGNYLLLWEDVRAQLDASWYLDVAVPERQERLVRRRIGYGDSASDARRWASGSDEQNAREVAASKQFAATVVEWRRH